MSIPNLPPWIRLDQAFWMDDRMRRMPVESRYLFLSIAARIAQLGADGHLDADNIALVSHGVTDDIAGALAPMFNNGLLDRKADGVYQPNWLKWQEDTEQRRKATVRKTKAAIRKKEWRDNKDEPMGEDHEQS